MALAVPHLSEHTKREAVAATAAVAKKIAAAPSWSTIRDTFDPMGGTATLNDKGQTVAYKYPKSDDPETQRQINAKVYEMWNPHRRVSVGLGSENSARTSSKMVTVRTARGERAVLPEKVEKVERAMGKTRRTFGYSRTFAEAPYWQQREIEQEGRCQP